MPPVVKFWRLETKAEMETVRSILERRFPDAYPIVDAACESVDLYDLIRPGNPHEYDDVVREFLVYLGASGRTLPELTEEEVRDFCDRSFRACFAERPKWGAIERLAKEIAGRAGGTPSGENSTSGSSP